MAISFVTDSLKYRETTSDPWTDLIIDGGATVINPPDLVNKELDHALTSGTSYEFVSDGAYYAVLSINGGTSGSCEAYIYIGNYDYLAANPGRNAAWIRCMSPWVYLPAGTTAYARGFFTDPDSSGLFKAYPL